LADGSGERTARAASIAPYEIGNRLSNGDGSHHRCEQRDRAASGKGIRPASAPSGTRRPRPIRASGDRSGIENRRCRIGQNDRQRFGKPEAPQEILAELARDRLSIDILVNNAGLAHRGKFWEIPIEDDMSILRLNVEALLRLTKFFLPAMIKQCQGRVLNVASVAGFEPGPLLAVYHASKAFVLSFTEALATELENTGVTATALCPGPTDTDFFEKSGMLRARLFQRANVMAPQDVAKAGYEGLMAGERIVVPGVANKIIVFSRRLLPEATLAKMTEKLYIDTSDRSRERGDMELKAAQGR
jgi:short-subunit dehydrogenase